MRIKKTSLAAAPFRHCSGSKRKLMRCTKIVLSFSPYGYS